jgi:hypothetical protein
VVGQCRLEEEENIQLISVLGMHIQTERLNSDAAYRVRTAASRATYILLSIKRLQIFVMVNKTHKSEEDVGAYSTN